MTDRTRKLHISSIMQPYRFPIKHSRIRDVGKLPPVRIFFHKMSFYVRFCQVVFVTSLVFSLKLLTFKANIPLPMYP